VLLVTDLQQRAVNDATMCDHRYLLKVLIWWFKAGTCCCELKKVGGIFRGPVRIILVACLRD
jgi:hypothetical protein